MADEAYDSGVSDVEEEFDENEGELGPVPLFASEENIQMDLKNKRNKREIEVLKQAIEGISTRVDIMSKHLNNVEQEAQHTEKLCNVKNEELKTEEHLRALADRGKGRVQQEIGKIIEKRQALEDDMNIVQNDLFGVHNNIEQVKLELNWNQDEYEQWSLAVKQKDEDTLAIEKYTRSDEGRIKDLSLILEKLTVENHDTAKTLQDEITETQAKQIELEKTAEAFRGLHRERQGLIEQWQDSLSVMRGRDEEIRKAGAQYGDAMAELGERQHVLLERSDRLENHKKDNRDLAQKLQVKERNLASFRDESRIVKGKKDEIEQQMTILKSELIKAAEDLEAGRAQTINLGVVVEEKREKLEAARERYQQVKAKLEKSIGYSDKVEAMATQQEELLNDRNIDLKRANKDVELLKEKMFKESQTLFSLRQTESNMIAEISSAEAASRNLADKIRKLDAQSLRQQELVYNAEFQIQQLERKVSRASGIRTDEEKKVLNKRIAVLKEELQEAKSQNGMLVEQRKKLDNELRRSKWEQEKLTHDKATLDEAIAEMTLENSSIDKQLSTIKEQRDDRMVEHDVMKLELNRLKNALSTKTDEVFGLENRKEQLRMSMQERRKEVEVHQSVQKAEQKVAQDEEHTMKMELADRKRALAALRARYSAIATQSDGAESQSQAFFVIQAAQKREELQREGDILDGKIRIAEKEVRALEKTLRHLKRRNEKFRTGFQNADEGSKAAQRAASLEQQTKSAADNLFSKRKQLHSITHNIEDLQEQAENLHQRQQQALRRRQQLQSAFQLVERELQVEKQKLDRNSGKVTKQSQTHRKSAGQLDLSEPTVDEKRMRAMAIRENNQNVLYTLRELASEFPEIESSLASVLQEANLQLPRRPPSAAMSRADDDDSDEELDVQGTM